MNFFTLFSIQTGIYICVSAIMAGHVLFTTFGLKGALIGLAVGSILLWGIGLVFARLAMLRRKVLVDLVYDYFGPMGAKICGIAFGISLLGWFAIQLEMMSKGFHRVYPGISVTAGNIGFGTLVILNVLHGITWMGRLTNLSVPFLLGMMGYVVIQAYDPSVSISYGEAGQGAYVGGVALTMAVSIAGVVDTPTYFCVSRSEKDAYLAITMVYLLVLPLIAGIGMVLALYAHSSDFVANMMGLGGTGFQFLVMCFLVAAGWTTNNGNLYSASMALSSCVHGSYRMRTLCLGMMGTMLSCFGVMEHFCETLTIMSIPVGSLGAALMGRFICDRLTYIPLTRRQQQHYIGMILLGTGIGFVGSMDLLWVSASGFLDAFCSTGGLVLLYEGGRKWKQPFA